MPHDRLAVQNRTPAGAFPTRGGLERRPVHLAPAGWAEVAAGGLFNGCLPTESGHVATVRSPGSAPVSPTGLSTVPSAQSLPAGPRSRPLQKGERITGSNVPCGGEAKRVLKQLDRLMTPLLRKPEGQLHPVDWHTALETFCTRFKRVQSEYGRQSLAFLSTSQLVIEELAFLGALARFGMGIDWGASGARPNSPAQAELGVYQRAFGFEAPPFTFADCAAAETLVFVGFNPSVTHPRLWNRVQQNIHHPKVVVIDSQRTDTAAQATLHVVPRPQTVVTLLRGLARVLLEQNWIDVEFIHEHTQGFDEFARQLQPYSLARVHHETGVDPDTVLRLAGQIQQGRRSSLWWAAEGATRTDEPGLAECLVNIALMTGNIGRPGTGANAVSTQCNAQGSRLFSNTTTLLGGHDFENRGDRHKVASALGIPSEQIPTHPCASYHDLMAAIEQGQIKGLWIIATNPAHEWLTQNRLLDVRRRLEFLVVQDMHHTTATAQLADLILPSASWGEKSGTCIDAERRFSLVKQVSLVPGQALPDFSIFRLIAEYWGCGDLFRNWSSPAAVFEILRGLSRTQPCDFSGIRDYEQLDAAGGIQWPCRESTAAFDHERRLFEDGQFYHPDGRARFLLTPPAGAVTDRIGIRPTSSRGERA